MRREDKDQHQTNANKIQFSYIVTTKMKILIIHQRYIHTYMLTIAIWEAGWGLADYGSNNEKECVRNAVYRNEKIIQSHEGIWISNQ